ncbi:MAG: hypothetical protein AMXMBFR52_10240 [Burkholderiales bacterium]
MKRSFAALLFAALAPFALAPASAQSFPDHPLRLIVPYPPGASTDILGRAVAEKMTQSLGQPVIVENKGGASGNIGSQLVAAAKPDGYTFMVGTDATHAANYHLTASPPFHPLNDFKALTLAVANPIVLITHPSVPVKNVQELIAYVKSHPDKGAFGSSGIGSPHHLAGELLKQMSGAPLVHVAYRGGGPAMTDVLGGQIPMVFASVVTALPHIREGKVHAIAVTMAKRYDGLPDVPAIAETIPGFEMNSWLAFFAPAGLSPELTRKLNGEIVRALKDPAVHEKMDKGGLVVVANSPEAFAEQQRRDFEQRGKLIRDAGIKAE